MRQLKQKKMAGGANVPMAGMRGGMRRKCARPGMEMVQVAILVAIAIVIGLIFREQIESFVNGVFGDLSSGKFK